MKLAISVSLLVASACCASAAAVPRNIANESPVNVAAPAPAPPQAQDNNREPVVVVDTAPSPPGAASAKAAKAFPTLTVDSPNSGSSGLNSGSIYNRQKANAEGIIETFESSSLISKIRATDIISNSNNKPFTAANGNGDDSAQIQAIIFTQTVGPDEANRYLKQDQLPIAY